MAGLTEEQRKELYSKLVAQRQGRSPRETGEIVGGIAQSLSQIAGAGSAPAARAVGIQQSDVGAGARAIGAAQEQAESAQVAKWRELLGEDRRARQAANTQKNAEFNQGISTRQQNRLDERLDWDMDPNNPANRARSLNKGKRFEWRQAADGTYIFDNVTKQYEKVADKPKPEPEARPIPASVAMKLSDYKSIDDSLDQLLDIHGKLDTGALATGVDMATSTLGVPNTAGALYDAQLAGFLKNIGKMMEGGKMTDADVAFVEKALPRISDTAESAQQKAQTIKDYMRKKREGAVKGLQQAGYDVPNDVLEDLRNAADQLETPAPKPVKQVKYQGKLYNVDENGDMTEVE